MAKETINLKADREVKRRAQQIAQDLGMPLSTVINAYLKQFIRTGEVHFYTEEKLNPNAKKRLDRLEKEAKAGKHISPPFHSAKEMDAWLDAPDDR